MRLFLLRGTAARLPCPWADAWWLGIRGYVEISNYGQAKSEGARGGACFYCRLPGRWSGWALGGLLCEARARLIGMTLRLHTRTGTSKWDVPLGPAPLLTRGSRLAEFQTTVAWHGHRQLLCLIDELAS